MPDFSAAEYASYRKLCHDLWDRLEREQLQPGDFYLKDGRVVLSVGRTAPADWKTRLDIVWLPTLADWLEMLHEAGWWRRYELNPLAGGDYSVTADGPPVIVGPSGNSDLAYPRRSGSGPTYEEAAARLWMAVTKTKVPA